MINSDSYQRGRRLGGHEWSPGCCTHGAGQFPQGSQLEGSMGRSSPLNV